jgi:hypothetical protein
MIKMIPVSSGHIESIGYDADQDLMVVRFSSGAEYVYSNVSFDTFESIREASSVGSALARSGLKGVRL